MTIDVDKMAAAKILQAVRAECQAEPVERCQMSATIDFVLTAKNSLTYRYIMFTALLAKATDERVDILSLQASDEAAGAYDARSLCSKTVYPFQKMFLGDVIDGSNSDPLVNKPGRYPRLSPSNKAQGGDPTKALNLLCRDLAKVRTSTEARECLSYLITRLLARERQDQQKAEEFAEAAQKVDAVEARKFIDSLVDQGFGGAAITIVASAMLRVLFPLERGYEVMPHPMNQAGSSSRQYSDLDVLLYHQPWLGVELKDKPFSSSDVEHAAKTAHAAGASRLLFVGGRASTISDQTSAYFSDARSRWMGRGVYLGIISIDALVDTVFATADVDVPELLSDIKVSAERIKAIEATMWVYQQLEELKARIEGELKKQS